MSKNRLEKLLLVSYHMRRMSYVIRGIAGAYVVYLMYQLFSEAKSSGEELTPVMALVGILMALAGVYFVIGAVYAVMKGIYAENDPDQIDAGGTGEEEAGDS